MQEHAIRKMSVCLVLGIGFIRMVTVVELHDMEAVFSIMLFAF
jgi:hypothetical protein